MHKRPYAYMPIFSGMGVVWGCSLREISRETRKRFFFKPEMVANIQDGVYLFPEIGGSGDGE